MMKKITIAFWLLLCCALVHAQNGLENITVETYYVSNAADAAGSVGTLPVGSVTYRVYVDMLPGYKFQAAYGVPGHALTLSTTTSFFNNEERGAITPGWTKVQAAHNSVMLDSWISVGQTCAGNIGILKSEDNVGTGGANIVNSNGILQNTDQAAGIPLTTQDGYFAGSFEPVQLVGITNGDLSMFAGTSQAGNSFTTSNGSWASLNGSSGPIPATNRVLIAQITTDGVFHYELNIQIGTPTGGVQNFVAKNPVGNEISIPSLTGTLNQPSTVNVVVCRVGDGIVADSPGGNAVFLDYFTTSGAASSTDTIPSSGATPLIQSGNATSEGQITRSADKQLIVIPGYATAAPFTSSLASSASATVNRAIGTVNTLHSFSRVATSSTFYNLNNIRGAASDGLNNYWGGGNGSSIANGGGTNYFGTSTAASAVQTAILNTRVPNVFSGKLYFSSGSAPMGIYQVGAGLPVTSGQTNTLIINTSATGSGSVSPYGFYFNDAQTICYIADDRSISTGGGIQKWTGSGTTWTLAYTLGTGSGSTVGARGIAVDFSAIDPIVYATTAEGTGTRLIKIIDGGSASIATTLATAGANKLFRSCAFAPLCLTSATTITSNSPICDTTSLVINLTATGFAPLTYSWTGPGNYTSTVEDPIISNAHSGYYIVTVTNGCGAVKKDSVLATVNLSSSWYIDNDADGFGTGNAIIACTQPAGRVTDHSDCNDNNAAIHPGAAELCNNLDDNCDGQIDNVAIHRYYADADGDGFGNTTIYVDSCAARTGYVLDNTDCNDNAASQHPGATEICANNIDDNCNGQTDEGCSATLNIKVFIEGYYAGNGTMVAVVDPINYPALCDTITVELHDDLSPYDLVYSITGTIDINGNGQFIFPSTASNQSFYIVVKTRNTIETWSKNPVVFDAPVKNFDFTTLQ